MQKNFRSGADKIAINTAAVKKPELIKDLAEKFGSQAIVLSIEAKNKKMDGKSILTTEEKELELM